MPEDTILNLTQHAATQDQAEAGVFEPRDKAAVQDLLTFDSPPREEEIVDRAHLLASLALREHEGERGMVMIGGAPFFMSSLERALRQRGLIPVYSFSVRESVESHLEDGTVKKSVVFRHAGFVHPPVSPA